MKVYAPVGGERNRNSHGGARARAGSGAAYRFKTPDIRLRGGKNAVQSG
jgi:hypothetical protein